MDNEFYNQAMNIIRTRHMNAVAENEARIEEVNDRIPEIRQVNDAIYNTGRELIKIISERKNAAERIEQLKEYNLGAQRMTRTLLVQHGYPEDYLDMNYVCKKCNDTGYSNSAYCDCFKKLYGKLAADELNKNSRINLSSFDTFDLSYYNGSDYDMMGKIFRYSKKYAENFGPHSDSILMMGQTGRGKTHLSLAIANEVIRKGYTVVYDSVSNVLQCINDEHFGKNPSGNMSDTVISADLLILDDLGTEFPTAVNASTIYNIINTRITRGIPTIISTNLNVEGIQNRYEPRVVSRITSQYTCLQFVGEDIRYLSKQRRKKERPDIM